METRWEVGTTSSREADEGTAGGKVNEDGRDEEIKFEALAAKVLNGWFPCQV